MLTKEEIEARIAAARAKKGPKPAPINNTKLIEEFRAIGGRIHHVRPSRRGRGLTFAFIARNNRVEIATAVTHTNDGFAKKMGTKTAIDHFREGKTVFFPLSSRDRKSPARLIAILGALLQ